jgi:predicted enzyme related to lactoylglutathione lyase
LSSARQRTSPGAANARTASRSGRRGDRSAAEAIANSLEEPPGSVGDVLAFSMDALCQDRRMANVWSGVTIDCLDPERVARFWSALLGREPGPSQEGWVYLGERGDLQPRLVFQPVSEPQTGKVRIHLDISVDDIDEAVTAVINLGGRFTGERHDYDEGVVVVMADPEDHEFCLVEYHG